MELYNYRFSFKDSEGNLYKLRAENLLGATIRYRHAGSTESFTETGDFNINENEDSIWVRLPAIGKTEIGINITVEPLRNVCTPLTVIDLVPYTTSFTMSATPTPVESLQGFSPRVINGYWFEFSDETQTFVNTYIKAEATIITEGEVTDKIEQGNPNPISSGGVWNFYNEQQTINNQVDNHFTNIENKINEIESEVPTTVILNGDKYIPNDNNEINLGYIETTPNTHMLSQLTEIDGKWYPKGTEVDNNKVYATDGYYYDYCDTKAIDGKSHISLFSLRPGWYRIQYQVYTTNIAGDIYVSKQGERGWSVITTSKQVADTFQLYYSSTVSAPNLVVRASSGYYIGRFNLMTDQNIQINKWPMDLTQDRLVNMKYFLTDVTEDTIEIDTNNYVATDTAITNYVVTVDGPVSYSVDNGVRSANDFVFNITQPQTSIIFNDGNGGVFQSDVCEPGTTATLIYESPDSAYWSYKESGKLNVKDVLIDNVSCVANRVAYIHSFTISEVNSIMDLFR